MRASKIKERYNNLITEQELADVFAIASNNFWNLEDNEYDYKEGTPEYIAACAETDEWLELKEFYENKIFEIIRGEGTEIPDIGVIVVLAPFMKKYGYDDENGWWIKININ
ncbi:MAG: hypothetical protein RR988_05825 [Clostridia bacterium]